MTIEFRGESGCRFELFYSAERRAFRVRIAPDDDNWDYDDEADARDMSADLKGCASLVEAREVIGV